MATDAMTRPVNDSVPKVNDEIAVGSDLEFQRRWWRFEGVVWTVFSAVVLLALAGCLGRGYLAKARVQASDRSMDVAYERIERYSTPSVMDVKFGSSAIKDAAVQLWVSDALVKPLGNERVVPQPAESRIGNGGITYKFGATEGPLSVRFALQPSAIGRNELRLQVPGHEAVAIHIFVMP